MKNVALCILIVIALTVTVNACNKCPPNRDPKCGFNGSCIYEFNNACELIRYNCMKRAYFRQTDSYQCSSAKNGNSRYHYCFNSNGNLW